MIGEFLGKLSIHCLDDNFSQTEIQSVVFSWFTHSLLLRLVSCPNNNGDVIMITETVDILRSDITQYWTQYENKNARTLFRSWTHNKKHHSSSLGRLFKVLWRKYTARNGESSISQTILTLYFHNDPFIVVMQKARASTIILFVPLFRNFPTSASEGYTTFHLLFWFPFILDGSSIMFVYFD